MRYQLLLALFACGGALSVSDVASAAHWMRVGAPSCQKLGDEMEYNFGYSAYTYEQTICPLFEQNGLERDELTNLTVYLEDNNMYQSGQVQLCRRTYDYTGGACGSVYSTGAPFMGAKAPDLSELDESQWLASWTGSAYVLLSSSGATYRSRGYLAQNSNGNESAVTAFRGQPAFCTPEDWDDNTKYIATYSPRFKDGVYQSGAQSSHNELICPLLERDGLARADLASLTIYGYDGSGAHNLGVSLCRAAYDADGGSCGAEETSAGTGNVLFELEDFDVSAWQVGTGSTYMRVRVPQANDIAYSEFRSFYLSSL